MSFPRQALALCTLFLACAAAACKSHDTVDSSSVDEAQIYRTIRVELRPGDETLRLYIDFRVGGNTGTTVKLVEPSGITVNGEPIAIFEDDDVAGTYYQNEINTKSLTKDAFNFAWTQKSGAVVEEEVELLPESKVMSPEAGSKVSRDSLLQVTFEPSLTADATMDASVLDRCPYQIGRKTARATAKSGDMVSIQSSDLARLGTGAGCVFLTHDDDYSIATGDHDLGGHVFRKRVSETQDLTIE